MPPLRILLLSDGRPGHYHLAEGVCAALGRLRPVEIVKHEIRRRKQAPSRLLMAGLHAGLVSPAAALRLGYGLKAAEMPTAALVISAGGDTIAANVAAARFLDVPNIFCGTVRHAVPDDFALIVSSYARHAGLPRHIVTLKPTAMDPASLGRPVAPPRLGPDRPPALIALLIGGDSGLFHYRHDEWNQLVGLIEGVHVAWGAHFLVSTSRRTPDEVADALAALAGRSAAIAELIDYRTAGPGTLPQILGRAEAALVTEDSSTMISEAIAARLAVVGVAPADHGFKPEEAEYRALMVERRWARFIALAQLKPAGLLDAFATVEPMADNHLDTLAHLLAERLPHLAPASRAAV